MTLRIEGFNKNEDGALGKYIYCVIEGNGADIAFTGMDDKRLSIVSHEDLSAVVQDSPQGLSSKDGGVLRELIIAHHKVVDAAVKRFGAVLPFCFGNIVTGGACNVPTERIELWLGRNYSDLKGKLKKVKGKAEYGVQVLWNPRVMAFNLIDETPELKRLDQAARASSPGTAFLYGEQLKIALRRETEALADERFKAFYGRIKNAVDEIKIEGIKHVPAGLKREKVEGVEPLQGDERMLMNLSCLAHSDKAEELGRLLDNIEREGFTVLFTGPWPPYSFV